MPREVKDEAMRQAKLSFESMFSSLRVLHCVKISHDSARDPSSLNGITNAPNDHFIVEEPKKASRGSCVWVAYNK
jgi:hypothetical protein